PRTDPFRELPHDIVIRFIHFSGNVLAMSLESVRTKINQVDDEIVRLIVQRQRLAIKVSDIKAREGLPVRDEKRARQVISTAGERAQKARIDPEPVKKIFEILIAMSEASQHARNGIKGQRDTPGHREESG
ncbi:MAG: chorismate mutase, partial [Methanoregula sp.]|nr:chorismate mutase [Methanoregula sp.]